MNTPLIFLQDVLHRADPPDLFGKCFTHQLKEISGAAFVLLVQHSKTVPEKSETKKADDHTNTSVSQTSASAGINTKVRRPKPRELAQPGSSDQVTLQDTSRPLHRIVSIAPENRYHLLEEINSEYLLDLAFQEEEISKWTAFREEGPFEPDFHKRRLKRNLRQMRMEWCVVVPLTAEGERIGTILLFDLPDRNQEQAIDQILTPLLPTIASLLRGSFAYEEMTKRVEQRSKQLEQSEEDHRKAERVAEEANHCKSEFLANISHEIRTPMTAILGFADIIREHAEDAQSRQAAGTIQKNGQLLLSIINDILDISRIEAGKMEMHPVWLLLQELIDDIEQLLLPVAKKKGLDLKTRKSGQLPKEIFSDPMRLKQILIHILANAVKFSESGIVRFSASLSCNQTNTPLLKFTVSDEGVGITPEKLRKIFQPFAPGDSSLSRRHGGTGLGLAISKQIAQLLGGDVMAESIPEVGSTFTVTVRAAPSFGKLEERQRHVAHRALKTTAEKSQEEAEASAREIGSQEGTKRKRKPSLAGKRILLIEDGIDNQRLIALLLQKEGADVLTASDGKQGVAMFRKQKAEESIDLILMDLQMPILDGFDATRQIREIDPEIPIVALTAHAMPADREKCLQAGCSEYLAKPIDRQRLIEVIDGQLKPEF